MCRARLIQSRVSLPAQSRGTRYTRIAEELAVAATSFAAGLGALSARNAGARLAAAGYGAEIDGGGARIVAAATVRGAGVRVDAGASTEGLPGRTGCRAVEGGVTCASSADAASAASLTESAAMDARTSRTHVQVTDGRDRDATRACSRATDFAARSSGDAAGDAARRDAALGARAGVPAASTVLVVASPVGAEARLTEHERRSAGAGRSECRVGIAGASRSRAGQVAAGAFAGYDQHRVQIGTLMPRLVHLVGCARSCYARVPVGGEHIRHTRRTRATRLSTAQGLERALDRVPRVFVHRSVTVVVQLVAAAFTRTGVDVVTAVVAVAAAANAGRIAVHVAVERLEGTDACGGVTALVGGACVGIRAVGIGRAGTAHHAACDWIAGFAGTADCGRDDVTATAGSDGAGVRGAVDVVVALGVRGAARRSSVGTGHEGIGSRNECVHARRRVGIKAGSGVVGRRSRRVAARDGHEEHTGAEQRLSIHGFASLKLGNERPESATYFIICQESNSGVVLSIWSDGYSRPSNMVYAFRISSLTSRPQSDAVSSLIFYPM